MTESLLEVDSIDKNFGAVRALSGASLALARGEITALVGDNGAGKSTLVRCITGVHRPDAGSIRFNGTEVHFHAPEDARALGIETVYQDLALVEDLTVWQNLFLNREITRGIGPLRLLDKRAMIASAEKTLSRLAVNVPSVRSTVRRMSGGQRQSIAISRAISWGSTLVIMDEPTAALGVRETRAVEELIRRLREEGITVLLISHDFDQVMRLSDQVWVMRQGTVAGGRRTSETTGEQIVAMITGVDTERPTP
ncbi:MAG TPA: ATP-binding cassette domain-containing protein [Pseudonocardiaceae bacterium]|nr:ATP-binding cassette domain-containing protein [Pseudonocardiaceae bacterium]